MTCPDPDKLQALVDGIATRDEGAALRVHLESCVACRSLVLDATLPLAPAPAPNHPVSTGKIEIGDAVGRYIVTKQIGAGGMGVVYAAYDPELDRKVALKLIRRRDNGSEASTYAREIEERLLREGQAMARVAHPNVTAVYDVGRHGDQVFVAMELIVGETLAQWLGKPRSPAQILDVFKRAAQGLQAAHAVGLVHRDFKPNNVMIDGDERVRVMDFGLARPTGAMQPSPASPSNRLAHDLTVTGMLMGTPAYMAPEQLRCEPADARSDQFSFCVALYEALCGTRPYVAPTTDELLAKIHARELTPPTRKAPAWLLRVIDRGLKPSPGERWPSMQALMDALDRDPSRRRRRWVSLLGAVTLLVVGAGAGLAFRLHANHAIEPGVLNKQEQGHARELYEHAVRDFELMRYTDATREFEDAYRESGQAPLLFNAAQNYSRQGRKAEAIHFYRLFLEHMPDATNRAQVESTLKQLEQPR